MLLTSAAVGVFAAPLRLVTFLGYVGLSVANAVTPRMSLEGDGPDVRAFTASLRWLLTLHIALAIPLVVWAEPISLLLLGREFSESAEVLRALAPFLVLRGVSPLISTTVNYLGEAGRRVPIVLVSLAVNAAIDLALLPVLGPVAAAIGTGVAYCIYVPAHLRLCRHAFAVPLRPLALSGARALLAGAAMAAVLFALGTHELAVWRWPAGVAGGLLAFLAVLVATRELTRADLAEVQGMLRRRRAG
jgi:O-antigen/teichoic acid export membrane protein